MYKHRIYKSYSVSINGRNTVSINSDDKKIR